MRVVFVDNLLLERSGGMYDYVLQPHLGLISLIAVAENAGHSGLLYDPKLAVAKGVFALDADLYRNIAADILACKPETVGFTSLGCNFICTLKVAGYLRELEPDLPVMLGGPHATVLDRQIVGRFPQFDVVVRNEAELKLLPLLDAIAARRFADVPGITYREGGGVVVNPGEPVIEDLDAIPKAAYGHYPVSELGLQWVRVEAGRGCPFMCTFCSTASFFGRRYRLKSARRLCSDLDDLHARYGITHFSLTHDLFTVNRAKVVEFCQTVSGRGYTWKCSARMDCVDEELLELMSAAGCREIYYGVETGSARMQKVSQKRLDLALFHPTLGATSQTGMAATVSFITGYPQETQADQDATLDAIGSCFFRDPAPHMVQLHLLTPEPGTQLLAEFGGEMGFDGYVTDFNFPTLEADDALVMRAHPEVFMNHHYFRSVVPRERNVFVTSLYDVVYRLGFAVLARVIDAFGGRFSAFVADVYEWASRGGGGNAPATDATLCDFFNARFGPRDHLTSLVRYMTAAARVGRAAAPPPRAIVTTGPVCPASGTVSLPRSPSSESNLRGEALPGQSYQISDVAELLRDIHDCPGILRFLERAGVRRVATARWTVAAMPKARSGNRIGAPPSAAAGPSLVPVTVRGRQVGDVNAATAQRSVGAGQRGVTAPFPELPNGLRSHRRHLLLVADRDRAGMLRNFRVNGRTASVLDGFRVTRTVDDVARAMGLGRGAYRDLDALVDEMLGAGVLRIASATPTVHSTLEAKTARAKYAEWGDVDYQCAKEANAGPKCS